MPKEIDFFDNSLKVGKVHRDNCFGICDDGKMAFTIIDGLHKWNACIKNNDNLSVHFLPIDHRVEAYSEKGAISLCDGMLFVDEWWLAFVEVKTSPKDWISKAVQQLISTIKLYLTCHPDRIFKYKEAYASNTRHPQYHYSERETMARFRKETGFKLILCFTITVPKRNK